MKLTKNKLREMIKQALSELKEGGPGSGRPTKPGSKRHMEKGMDKAVDDANAKLDAAEKAMKAKKKKKKVKESIDRKTTVKEVKRWMKSLEENRYKKTYASDARRVSWLVNNNLSEDYDTMPVSMKKKWPKAAYKRERFLAKEFAKHLKSKKVNENKLRSLIQKVIQEELKRG